jgi:hypothetical protein
MRRRLHNILLEMSDGSQQKLKRQLFTLWDKTGPNLDLNTLKYVGIDNPRKISELTQVYKFFRQYIGGNDVALEKFKELSNNVFHAKVGGYDFKFKIDDYTLVEDELINNHIYLDDLIINLMPGGTVFVENENKRFFISDLFGMTPTELQKKYGDFDEDILYEIVNFEMEDVVKQVLENEITNKTGIDINEIKSFE